MAVPIKLPEYLDDETRFIEETDPSEIVAGTIAKLKAGIQPAKLLAASAVAVSRSTELPALHHGGPIHPVAGIHAVYHTAQRLRGDWGFMPVVQNVALANKHLHAPDMGPWIMPELAPARNGSTSKPDPERFATAIRELKASLAERELLLLLDNCSPGQILDLMLTETIRRNALDDHYFLYPVFTVRALDCIGWEWAPILLRGPVRYLASNARALASPRSEFYGDIVRCVNSYDRFSEVEALLDTYALLESDIKQDTSEEEEERICALGERIGMCEKFSGVPEMIAQALVAGLSLDGVGKSLSIAAGLLHLRSKSGNPFDVHYHTGVNTRRYVVRTEGVSLRNKILVLLSWSTGPEVWMSESNLDWQPRAAKHTLDALPQRTPDALLDALCEAITARKSIEALKAVDGQVASVVLEPEIQSLFALAQQYADAGYDVPAYFARLGEVICRDDFSEMHAFKHHQAVVEEYASTPAQYRWVYLVSAAKVAACTHGLTDSVYREAQAHLAI